MELDSNIIGEWSQVPWTYDTFNMENLQSSIDAVVTMEVYYPKDGQLFLTQEYGYLNPILNKDNLQLTVKNNFLKENNLQNLMTVMNCISCLLLSSKSARKHIMITYPTMPGAFSDYMVISNRKYIDDLVDTTKPHGSCHVSVSLRSFSIIISLEKL